MSQLRPARAFSPMKIASLDFRKYIRLKNEDLYQGGCSIGARLQQGPRAAGAAKSIGLLHWHSSLKNDCKGCILSLGAGSLRLLILLKEICRKPISQHPGLGDSLLMVFAYAQGCPRQPCRFNRRARAAR